ncbi:MAG: protein-L-isoaspartate O-methyltransferase [Hyphomicrobiales bacterium]|nr:protein-L-isoaspartate O-methyltransferase [Hyphomicrobiales bacterium]
MTDYKVERAAMIESQIRPNNVTDARLLEALYRTPREAFVPPSLQSLAYMDGPLRVEPSRDGQAERYLLAPMVLARLIQLARVSTYDRVLDVGPATGYSTAILAQLGKEVVALETDAGLLLVAQDAIESEGLAGVKSVIGPLADGAPAEAQFDVIFVNGRLTEAPETLLKQLAPGGRLVALIGNEVSAKATKFTRLGDKIQSVTEFDAGAPMLPGFTTTTEFAF